MKLLKIILFLFLVLIVVIVSLSLPKLSENIIPNVAFWLVCYLAGTGFFLLTEDWS